MEQEGKDLSLHLKNTTIYSIYKQQVQDNSFPILASRQSFAVILLGRETIASNFCLQAHSKGAGKESQTVHHSLSYERIKNRRWLEISRLAKSQDINSKRDPEITTGPKINENLFLHKDFHKKFSGYFKYSSSKLETTQNQRQSKCLIGVLALSYLLLCTHLNILS